jgi:hypothetical protein
VQNQKEIESTKYRRSRTVCKLADEFGMISPSTHSHNFPANCYQFPEPPLARRPIEDPSYFKSPVEDETSLASQISPAYSKLPAPP